MSEAGVGMNAKMKPCGSQKGLGFVSFRILSVLYCLFPIELFSPRKKDADVCEVGDANDHEGTRRATP